MKDKLLLIDGNSIMNRAFYGIPLLTNSEGLYTNAVYGFLNILSKSIEEENASHIVVAFDLKAPTFRHNMYSEYKGNRKGMPDELRPQMGIIKEILRSMNISISELEGYEADDILGTLATTGEDEGMDVTILSGDRDMLQLATDNTKISIPKTKKGTTTIENYFKKDVFELYSVTPDEFIDVKGLMGDTSDNIPGIPGIGEKTAIKIIKEFHSIENAYNNVDKLTTRIANKITEHYEIALISKELATICKDCDVNVEIQSCKTDNLYNEQSYELFKKYEFKSLLNKFDDVQTTDNSLDLNIIKIDKIDNLQNVIKDTTQIGYNLITDEEVTILTLTCNGTDVYYIDNKSEQKEELYSFIIDLLNNTNINKITHNLKEQLHALDIDLATNNLSIYDLSLASYILNPIKDSYNIDDIAKDYLSIMYSTNEEIFGKGKSKKTILEIDEEVIIDYYCKGSQILYSSFEVIIKKLEEFNLTDLYFNIELPLLYVLKSVETIGMKVDANSLKEYGEKLQLRIDELQVKIYEDAGETFNINSPKQLGVVLFEKLELPIIKKTKTSYSTAADVLEKLKTSHTIIERIIEYRQLAKLKSTYADGLFEYIEDDSRIHSNFNQKVTSTGRISSTEPNLQNIPIKLELGREIRKVFIPEDDYIFIDADYSQIELRLLAHLSDDESFINAFNNNLDIHRITASQVFYVPFEEVTDLQRRNAKAVNFGIVYGISAYGLSQDLNITRKEADEYIKNYFSKYPKVKSFLDTCIVDAKEKGYVTTMYNRIRMIPELKASNFMQRSFGERVAMNTPIQGSAADIIKIAMINVYNALNSQNLKSRLILQVHDELLIEAHKDEVDIVNELLIKEMENAVSLKVPLTVDSNTGQSWYDAK
jgi:DNA polymerase-1